MISINGVFYDVSRFNHPGGKLVLQNLAGKDATAEFRLFHPPGTNIRLEARASGVPQAQTNKMLEFLELEKHMRDIGLFKSSRNFMYRESAYSGLALCNCNKLASARTCVLCGLSRYVLVPAGVCGSRRGT